MIDLTIKTAIELTLTVFATVWVMVAFKNLVSRILRGFKFRYSVHFDEIESRLWHIEKKLRIKR